MIPLVLISNYSEIMSNFSGWALQGYMVVGMGVFYAIVFSAVGGYVYLKNQSVVVWAIVMLIFMAAFGNALIGVDMFVSFVQICFVLAITGLFLVFFTKFRR